MIRNTDNVTIIKKKKSPAVVAICTHKTQARRSRLEALLRSPAGFPGFKKEPRALMPSVTFNPSGLIKKEP